MQYKGRVQDIRGIGNELGARYIVGGSVRRFQESVRITVQLVDVATNRQLWGNTYKGELDDIFDIQEQVAEQIVEALRLKLSMSEKVRSPSARPSTRRPTTCTCAARTTCTGMSKRGTEYAVQLFEKAIELDPRYAAAYAGCSCAYGQMYQWFSREEKYRDKAQEFSFKALMYDGNLAEAYTAMACRTSSGASSTRLPHRAGRPSTSTPKTSSRAGPSGGSSSRAAISPRRWRCFSASSRSSPGLCGLLRSRAGVRGARAQGGGTGDDPARAGDDAQLPAPEPGRFAGKDDLRDHACRSRPDGARRSRKGLLRSN